MTESLLASLAHADFTCQVILIDDHSSRPIEPLLRRYPTLEIVYRRNSANRGPAISRNIGLELASHGFVAFTDNDCSVSPTWLIELHKSISEAPSPIAGVGGRVLAKGKDIYSRYYDYHKLLDPWYFRGQYYYITTANAIYRKHTVQAVKGFDPSVAQAGGEDPGLCFKLLNLGYAFGYNQDAIIFHDYEPSLRSFMRNLYRYGYGCYGQSKKHYRSLPFVESANFGGMRG